MQLTVQELVKLAVDYAKAHSEDQQRPVGAAVVSYNPYSVTFGTNHCNGAAIAADKSNVVHAEEDAIRRALDAGLDLSDGAIFITKAPCHHCAGLIAESGITSVFAPAPDPTSRWHGQQVGASLYLAGYRDHGVRTIAQHLLSNLGDLIRDYEEYRNGQDIGDSSW